MPLISRVKFVQAGSRLTAVEIVRRGRAPVIGTLHRTLLALGIVVSSYQALTGTSELTERIVFERGDGGSIESQLSDAAKAAILRVAIEEDEAVAVSPGDEDDSELDGETEA